MRRAITIIFLATFLSCTTEENTNAFKPGETTLKDTLNILGNPKNIIKNDQHKTVLYEWEKITIEFVENKMQTYFRVPQNQEVNLQYWYQIFKDEPSSVSVLDDTKRDEPLWWVYFPKKNIKLEFNERLNQVTRVYHE